MSSAFKFAAYLTVLGISLAMSACGTKVPDSLHEGPSAVSGSTRGIDSSAPEQPATAKADRKIAATGDNTFELEVLANFARQSDGYSEWQDTGLTIPSDTDVTFHASGTINWGTFLSPPALSGPEGTLLWGSPWPPSDALAPTHPFASLVGKLGAEGAPFLVGAHSTIRVSQEARLYLGLNDTYALDNSGEYSVSITLEGMDQLNLSAGLTFFSPNGDGNKDGLQLSVVSGPSMFWRLTVVGHGQINSGNGIALIGWNGKVSNELLPDGVYTLRLEDTAPFPTARPAEVQVSIDTVKPKMKFMVNGGVLKPDGTTIINDVIPEFRVKLSDDISGYDGVNAVRLEFQERPDGVTPEAVAGQIAYDSETRTFKCRVPFEENAILFPGDQWLKVSATDRAGNTSTRTVKFAVGAHSIPEAARSVQFISPAAPPPPRTLPLSPKVSPEAQKVRLSPKFLKRIRTSWRIPNVYGWMVRANLAEAVGLVAPGVLGVGGFVAAFAFGEDIEAFVANLAVTNVLIRVQSPVGEIDLPRDMNKLNSSHSVYEQDVLDALDLWKSRNKSVYELWSRVDLQKKIGKPSLGTLEYFDQLSHLDSSLFDWHMLLVTEFANNGLLLCTPVSKAGGEGNPVIPTSFWCGAPNPFDIDSQFGLLTRDVQWQYVESQVVWRRKADGSLASHQPPDPFWVAGDLDEPSRPYYIDKVRTRLAQPR